MKNLLKSLVLLCSALLLSGSAVAGQYGTAAEAKEMVKKAVAFLKKSDKNTLLKEVSNSKGKFVDRDLYISVYDANGVVLAHGVNPKIIGKDVSGLNDVDGKFFMKDILSQAKANGQGVTDYKWPHPETKEYQAKSAYYEMVDGIIISCGYYKY
jgi:cytochrome c